MGLFDFLMGSGSNETRAEAQRLGLVIAMVERDVPRFARNMQSLELVKGTATRYSLPRQRSTINTWELLQRLPSHGANMPNDYLLNSTGSISEELLVELRSVAAAFDEEYFEFEGTASEVAVFWEEWGGAQKARELHGLLNKLAHL